MSQEAAIENAEIVIEKFGGIRPMANKTNIPVTTIQGWKKRGKIPVARRSEILSLAEKLDIDLTGSFDFPEETKSAANENSKRSHVPRAESPQTKDSSINLQDFVALEDVVENNLMETIEKKMKQSENRAVTKSTILNLIVVGAVVAAMALIVWPETQKFQSEDERIAALEKDFEGLEKEQNILTGLVPKDLSVQLSDLQAKTSEGFEQVKDASGELMAGKTEVLEGRIAQVEETVSEIAGSPGMAAILEKFVSLGRSEEGSTQLDKVIGKLNATIAGLGSEESVDGALEKAREQSEAVGQTFENVPAQDLKAAAMLLGMTQFRSSLNRDGQPFQDDYQLLKNLAGEENVELQDALDKLAPHAESGVLTPEGLTEEFKTLSGEIVVDSLKGEDVSVQEKAQARLNELFQLEKDGELVTGTGTQASVAKAQKLLDQGDVQGAVAELKTLDGAAAETAAPWLSQAEATLAAQQVKQLLERNINLRAFGIGATQPYNFGKAR